MAHLLICNYLIMNPIYIVGITIALILVACKGEEVPPAPPPAIEISQPASTPVIPTVPASAASIPSLPEVVVKPQPESTKPKVDLMVFDKLNRECLITAASTKMTPDQCRDKAWKEAQK